MATQTLTAPAAELEVSSVPSLTLSLGRQRLFAVVAVVAMVPAVDGAGEPVLDENGEPVMVPNEARASWLDATTLTTSLNLGIMAYALSAFAIVVGLTLTALGWVVLRLRRATVVVA